VVIPVAIGPGARPSRTHVVLGARIAAPDGEMVPAAEIHRTALASLNHEFAEILDTSDAVARLESTTSS
jgi:hypothetical protein